jgi:hypothetical protein
MKYTKNDLVRMKAKLIRYYNQEKNYNSLLRLLKGTTLLFSSGTFVSFALCLEKLYNVDDVMLIGASCGAVAVTSGVGALLLNRESNNLEDEIFEYEQQCPDEVIEEAYRSVYK